MHCCVTEESDIHIRCYEKICITAARLLCIATASADRLGAGRSSIRFVAFLFFLIDRPEKEQEAGVVRRTTILRFLSCSTNNECPGFSVSGVGEAPMKGVYQKENCTAQRHSTRIRAWESTSLPARPTCTQTPVYQCHIAHKDAKHKEETSS